jgi:hypothetical protein
MPLRFLMYAGREYEKITDDDDLHKESLVRIPEPEFIVLYNGDDEFPDFKEMRLSDAFKQQGDGCSLELVAKVYNINKGRNAQIARRSKALSDYSKFIAEVKRNLKDANLGVAIREAVKKCMGRNILLDFLREHRSEVINMLTAEFNMRRAKKVWRKEAREEGYKEVFSLLRQGYSIDEAEKKLGLAK